MIIFMGCNLLNNLFNFKDIDIDNLKRNIKHVYDNVIDKVLFLEATKYVKKLTLEQEQLHGPTMPIYIFFRHSIFLNDENEKTKEHLEGVFMEIWDEYFELNKKHNYYYYIKKYI